MSQSLLRKNIPVMLCFVSGLVLILAWYFPTPELNSVSSGLLIISVLLSAFLMGVGVINLTKNHIRIINREMQKGSFLNTSYSIVFFITLFAFIIVGIILGPNNSSYTWLSDYIFNPLASTLYAMTVFYVVIATYRVFRVRSKQATVMLITSAIIIMFNTPLLIYFIPGLKDVGQFLNNVIVMSVFRGVTIGMGVGVLLLGIRVLMGMETSWMGARRDENE